MPDSTAGPFPSPSDAAGHGATPAAVLDGTPPTPPTATDRLPDPGSPRRRSVTWLLVVLLTIVVAVVQRLDHGPATPADPKAAAVIQGSDVGEVLGKLFIKLGPMIRQVGGAVAEEYAKAFSNQAAQGSAADQVWDAVVAAELVGDDLALEKLAKVREELEQAAPASGAEPAPPGRAHPQGDAPSAEATSILLNDIESFRLIYSGRLAELSQAQRDALVTHHGFFGKVALTHGLSDTDPARAPLLGGAGTLMAIVLGFALVLAIALLAGIVLFVITAIRLSQRRIRPAFHPPASGGSVYLETLALFLACFLLLQVALSVLSGYAPKDATWVTPVALASHWLLALVPLSALRGRSFAELRRDLGWTRGRGIFREMGAGIVGYLAGFPLFLASAAIAVLLIILYQFIAQQATGHRPPPPSNPLAERLGGFDAKTLALFFTLATVWAPLVEETIFRGTLFRHLRGSVGPVLSAMGSAFVFGIIHPVPVLLTIPLMTLGFNFAMMREWRGSLIAPMTAHCLHNATVLTLVISVMAAVKD